MKNILLTSCSLLLLSCAASVKTNFESPTKALSENDKVALLDIQHSVPAGAQKIGEAKYGDTGFSTDCNFNSNLTDATAQARQNGANIVKVTEKKSPDFWSTCHRMKVDFYVFSGNVSDLPQYKVQIIKR